MKINNIFLKPKKIIGLELRTTNQEGQSARDIPKHWEKFFKENVFAQIPNKISNTLYGIYTSYEKDHMAPYSLIVGCEVSEIPEHLPKGCVACETASSSYACIPVQGPFPHALHQAWETVWNSNIKRSFTTDLEVYDESFDFTSGNAKGLTLYIATK